MFLAYKMTRRMAFQFCPRRAECTKVIFYNLWSKTFRNKLIFLFTSLLFMSAILKLLRRKYTGNIAIYPVFDRSKEIA